MSATIAAGEYNSFEEAARNVVKVKYTALPSLGKATIYDKKYKNYKKVVASLWDVWRDLR